MADLLELLRFLQVFVFGGLGLVALARWVKRRGAPEAWAAVTFGSLAAVVVIGRFLPEHHDPAVEWIRRLNVVVVVLFPYFLFRFTATFSKPSKKVEILAGLLTVAAVIGPFLFDQLPLAGEPRTPAYDNYIRLVLVQWAGISVYVAARLWRAASQEPTVARRRMRTLALGAAGLAVAIVMAGTASGADEGVQVLIQLLAMATAVAFFLGLSPPVSVRARWRREEEKALRQAELALMEVREPRGVLDVLLPHVSRLVGGRGAVALRPDGSVIGKDRLTEEEAKRIAECVASDVRGPDLVNVQGLGYVLSVPLRGGWLAVGSSAFTPFFGAEEADMLRSLAVVAELALNRAELSQQEAQMRLQLAQAQEVARIGSWEWDMTTDAVTWSDQLYEIFGEDPDAFEADYEAGVRPVHSEDRPLLEAEVAAALETGGRFSVEHRFLRAGEERWLHSEGRVQTDSAGRPIRMIGVGHDITERKKQELYRDQFISNAAHELRTPLTSLLGFVEILANRRAVMTEEDMKEAYQVMERSGQRLASLVNNLLDLTKVQQGHVQMDLMEVPLRSTAQELVHSNPPPAPKEVNVEIPDGLKAIADPGRLGQVLLNLLTNAYKYGGDNIVIDGRVEGEEVLVGVVDDGPGVERGLVGDLFEPFRRGEGVSNVSGSGLGLSIVKMLVEAAGGRIWYEPVEPTGARFAFTLRRP